VLRKLPILIFVIITLALPLFLFAIKQNLDNRSSAAAADKLEAEEGVLGGNAVTKQDSSASGGRFIALGVNASPTPITTLKYPSDSTFSSVNPSSLSRPDYLSPVTDPNFNTKITRITDPSAFNGSTSIRHFYSKVAAWNKDGTKMMMQKYILDGKNYNVIKNITALTGEFRWSNTDPNKIYVIEADGDFRVWDVNSVTNTLIRTFTGFEEVRMGPWEGNLSNNDGMVVLSGRNGTDYTAIVFDIRNNREISRKTFTGKWDNGIDWASISPNGKYVVINHACGSPCVGSVKTYDLNLNYIVDIAPKGEHGDLVTDVDGYDYFVYVLGQNGYLTKTRIDTGSKTVVLNTSRGGHISCRNLQRPGWCYATLIGTGYNQAVAFKLDGSGTVQRFANHRSTNSNYDVQPKGVVSTDGTKMLWTSDWGHTDGSWFDYVAEMP
jgi:hypothetical protein